MNPENQAQNKPQAFDWNSATPDQRIAFLMHRIEMLEAKHGEIVAVINRLANHEHVNGHVVVGLQTSLLPTK